MVRESVAHLKRAGKEVMLDLEHFFDGYKANAEYTMQVSTDQAWLAYDSVLESTTARETVRTHSLIVGSLIRVACVEQPGWVMYMLCPSWKTTAQCRLLVSQHSGVLLACFGEGELGYQLRAVIATTRFTARVIISVSVFQCSSAPVEPA